MGTPLYMSPEQVEGKPLDCRSDLYSFGVTCYHMLTGNPPFVGETALGVAVQHLKKRAAAAGAAAARPAAGPVPHRPQDARQRPRRPLAVAARAAPRIAPRAAGILRRRRRRRVGVWESSATMPVDPRLEASRQLAAVMKNSPADTTPRWTWLLALGLAGDVCRRRRVGLVQSAAGAAAGGLPQRTRAGPRQPTRSAQFYCASQIGTEEAWRSVMEYYPEKESVVRRAKQQLARIYLREHNYDKAMAIFEELAASTDAAKEYRAWGLAGKVVVLTLEEKYHESAKCLNELWPLRGELRDEQMQKLLDRAIRQNREKLGAQGRKQWDELLKPEPHHGP